MPHVIDLDSLAREVDRSDYDPSQRYDRPTVSLTDTLKEIRYHAVSRYRQFDPCHGDDFERRILDWINNTGLSLEDQLALLRILPEIAFIDAKEMAVLYQTALSHQVYRWLMDQKDLDFRLSEAQIHAELSNALDRTWFCSITDSLNIAHFCHVNRLSTHEYRPEWRTLQQLGSKEKIRTYIDEMKIERLVVLEDVVGSGRQSCRVLEDMVQTIDKEIQLLFVPLIISEKGLGAVRRALDPYDHCTVEPVFIIPRSAHVRKTVNETSVTSSPWRDQ